MLVCGNCFAACVASILGVPITEVPNVEVLFRIEGNLWGSVMQQYLNSLGYEWKDNNDFKVFHDGNYGIEEGKRADLLHECRNKYYLVTGKSYRGVMHTCVFMHGKLVHDPHPSGEGLITYECFEEIIKL